MYEPTKEGDMNAIASYMMVDLWLRIWFPFLFLGEDSPSQKDDDEAGR